MCTEVVGECPYCGSARTKYWDHCSLFWDEWAKLIKNGSASAPKPAHRSCCQVQQREVVKITLGHCPRLEECPSLNTHQQQQAIKRHQEELARIDEERERLAAEEYKQRFADFYFQKKPIKQADPTSFVRVAKWQVARRMLEERIDLDEDLTDEEWHAHVATVKNIVKTMIQRLRRNGAVLKENPRANDGVDKSSSTKSSAASEEHQQAQTSMGEPESEPFPAGKLSNDTKTDASAAPKLSRHPTTGEEDANKKTGLPKLGASSSSGKEASAGYFGSRSPHLGAGSASNAVD